MGIVTVIAAGVLSVVSWIIWAIVVGFVFFAAVGLPWAIWEFFMFLTFNNIINCFAKLPSIIGGTLGFILTLPFAGIATVISIWAYIQTILMGILTFRGNSNDQFCINFIKECVEPLEFGGDHSFVIVRYYYEHCQWLWGGAGFQYSWFPWQNGCGGGWSNGNFWWPVGEMLPIEFQIIKLFLLGIPYVMLFLLPLLPVIWSITRPIVGACASLPAVSGNGDGRD